MTLSCQTNLLIDQDFDSLTNNGKLELTREISGKTILNVNYKHKYEVGFSEGAVTKHASFTIIEASKNFPAKPSISSGLFALYDQPAFLSLTEFISDVPINNLERSAVLQISYAKTRLTGFDPQSLKIAYYDDISRAWLVLPSTIDQEGESVRANIWWLGYYRVVASPLGWIDQGIANNKLYREQGTNHFYFVDQGIKHQVNDLQVLHSWSIKPEQAELSKYLYRLPSGFDLTYRDGGLLRLGAATFYYVEQGGKRLIMNKQVFDQIGWQADWAYQVERSELDKYFDLTALTSATTKPDNILVKYENSPKVYLIENSKKRWITSERAFTNNHWRWDRIITIPVFEIYPDGASID